MNAVGINALEFGGSGGACCSVKHFIIPLVFTFCFYLGIEYIDKQVGEVFIYMLTVLLVKKKAIIKL